MIVMLVSFLLHPVQFVKDMSDSYRCPECAVRPHRFHKAGCKVGHTDGGMWA